MYYQGYILPLNDYGSSTWGATSRNNIERLSKLQKRAARIILNADYDTASSDMFIELGLASITKRHNYNKAVLTYKALNNLTPSYISDLLAPISQTLNRMLRSSTNGSLAVPRSKTALFDRSFSSSAPRFWNQLPESVRKVTSLNVFKRNVKEYIWNAWFLTFIMRFFCSVLILMQLVNDHIMCSLQDLVLLCNTCFVRPYTVVGLSHIRFYA